DVQNSFYLQIREQGPAGAPALTALRRFPFNSRIDGPPSQGLVTLSNVAPAGGVTIALQSSAPDVVVVPPSVTVPADASSATFPITLAPVTTLVAASVSATLNGIIRPIDVTVTPPVPPDTISIGQAQWSRKTQMLQITATGTNSSALLKASATSNNATIGFMSFGANSFVGNFSWPVNPGQITVRSGFGGSATATVSTKTEEAFAVSHASRSPRCGLGGPPADAASPQSPRLHR